MSTQPVVVITNFVGMHVNAANVGVGAKNPDGSFNATGTVLGVSQTAHSAVDFARTGYATGKALPFVGGFLGAASAWVAAETIRKDLSEGKSPQQSDIAGLVGGAAAIVGGATLILGGGIIVPITLGVGVTAGIYQVVAGAKGWTLDDAKGLLFERELTPEERSEVNRIMHSLQDDPIYQQCMREYTGQVPVYNPGGLLPVDPWYDGLAPDFNVINNIKHQTQTASTIPSPIILDLDGDGLIGTVGLGAGVLLTLEEAGVRSHTTTEGHTRLATEVGFQTKQSAANDAQWRLVA